MYTKTDVDGALLLMAQGGASKAELVKAAADMCLGWPYVYAAAGEACTPSWRKNRQGYSDEKYSKAIHDACPVLCGSAGSCAGCKWEDCRCFDCRGFTRWVLEQAGIALYGGGATTQYNTASNWAVRGTIDKMPKGLICCVFKQKAEKMSHTGLHIVNDYIIHCSGTVKEDRLPGTPAWTHFGIPAGLYTIEELRKAGVTVDESKNVPTLRRGSSGDAVEELQVLLSAKYGAALEVDGVFGAKTEAAVKAFQKAHGLTADGVVGAKTRAALGWTVETAEAAPDSAEVVWNALLDAVGNAYGVAGIMGNLMAESGINPINLNSNGNRALGMSDQEYTNGVDTGAYPVDSFVNDGYAYGIAQWCYHTRKANLINYAASKRSSVGDLTMQVEFLIQEMRTYSVLWKTLKVAASVKEASDAVLTMYEKPANQGDSVKEKRAAYGQEFYERFATDTDVGSKEPEGAPAETVTISLDEYRTLKAGISAAYAVIRKFEEGMEKQ